MGANVVGVDDDGDDHDVFSLLDTNEVVTSSQSVVNDVPDSDLKSRQSTIARHCLRGRMGHQHSSCKSNDMLKT